jgi:hypothetical protein
MKAFGNTVVAGDAPHVSDFLTPGVKSIADRDQWREPATPERRDIAAEATGGRAGGSTDL